MPVPELDLRGIWNQGKTYREWLADCRGPMREEMEQFERENAPDENILRNLRGLARPVHVLAIAEDWCGDVRRHLPSLAKLCDVNEAIRLRIVDKESRPELMVRFLTNGAEAIPIFIVFNEQFVEVGFWGPRPTECKRLMARGKAAGRIDEARAAIKAFYDGDGQKTAFGELSELLLTAGAEEV